MTKAEPSEWRHEADSLGTVALPAAAGYGAQTARALALYPVRDGGRFCDYPALLRALLLVKRAAARANARIGALDPAMAEAIGQAAVTARADARALFPVNALHGGGGVSFNMNVNEVLANLANRDGFGRPFGGYDPIHPNDHVNLNHSTSDALSTACHIAARDAWVGLRDQIAGLIADLDALSGQWGDQRRIARTCLQDAVDIRFADYLGGQAENLRRAMARGDADAGELRHVSLGGNIIGRSGDCEPAFFAAILPEVNALLAASGQSADLLRTGNLFAASQAHEGLLTFAAGLEQTARGLIRLAGDLRLMGSGPHCGFGELILPAVQPGSSAIPGKINPTVPEFAIQTAMSACGHAAAIRMTQDHGELDYSPWQGVVVIHLLDMIELLRTGIHSLRVHCVQGMRPDPVRNDAHAGSLLPLLVRLKALAGYGAASRIAAQAGVDAALIRREIDRLEATTEGGAGDGPVHHDKEGEPR